MVEILRVWCDSLLCLGLREPLSWVNGERGHGRAWFVTLVSVGVVVIGDSSMVGVMVMIVNQIG